jgi:hypothetical protein
MNKRIEELLTQSRKEVWSNNPFNGSPEFDGYEVDQEKFAELIVLEMCRLMEQSEDDAYHCFDPSERPTESIMLLNHWQTTFKRHFEIK